MTNPSSDELKAMRHSLAHIMATAVVQLWPQAKLGVGPVVDSGFYYDIDLGDQTISDEDFSSIEKAMKKIIREDQMFEQFDRSIDEAIEWSKNTNQPYKEELLNDLKREGTTIAKDLDASELGTIAKESSKVDNVSFYRNGDFTDLCRGPHVESTGKVGAFKLIRVAGAYWRGKEDNPQMQRLYGVAFTDQDHLNEYLENQKLAEDRDHRKIGQELDLFTFSELVGSGLPLFTPKGTWLKELLNRYVQQLRSNSGYERVSIPHVTKIDLYKKSGHWDKYGHELFLIKSQETSDEMALKPMNCPHHTQIYASNQRSYRDLPIKYMETTMTYRDEKSGELHGLSRVRSITMDDTHVFCQPSQIKDVTKELIELAEELYTTLGMKLKFRLSFKDEKDGYLGEERLWQQAQETLEETAKEAKLDYFVESGEAAFYGPKIDFIAADGLGREWQVATVQLDFVQPDRFDLTYIDDKGEQQQPVMIHAALLGSAERFLSVYIEHTGGRFPLWLAPEQVRLIPVNDKIDDYVSTVKNKLTDIVLMKPLKFNELRVTVDQRNESLGKKIRRAEEEKVPVIVVIGSRDKDSETISLRIDGKETTVELDKLKDFITSI